MRKNIFKFGETKSAELELVLEGENFVLKRNGNSNGRKYGLRAAYYVARTILREIANGSYNGNFLIKSEVLEKIRDYEVSAEKPPFER